MSETSGFEHWRWRCVTTYGGRQTRRQTGRQMCRQVDRQADRPTGRQTYIKTDRQAGVVLSGVSCHTAPRDLVTHRVT